MPGLVLAGSPQVAPHLAPSQVLYGWLVLPEPIGDSSRSKQKEKGQREAKELNSRSEILVPSSVLQYCCPEFSASVGQDIRFTGSFDLLRELSVARYFFESIAPVEEKSTWYSLRHDISSRFPACNRRNAIPD
ncbi:hypothetical protein [Actinomadura opuntiae]|uniref:hypothetical protein n=1 Tax=Actinomadura sp. OS1-43 TaxID=604315 RepID=UPI00255AC559|nr:hypothetical protein [Actinomadura sp. OS1-43]MDL4816025.1 hypothetical protein [Actinomadura sp. OS1-43]